MSTFLKAKNDKIFKFLFLIILSCFPDKTCKVQDLLENEPMSIFTQI